MSTAWEQEVNQLGAEVVLRLEKLGWSFLPDAPNEWQWMKFDKATGYRIATQGDEVWQRELDYVRRAT